MLKQDTAYGRLGLAVLDLVGQVLVPHSSSYTEMLTAQPRRCEHLQLDITVWNAYNLAQSPFPMTALTE